MKNVKDMILRYVEKSDSKFVLDLRTDTKLGRNISFTSPNIDDQINWIEEYKKREAAEKEFYFVFEDLSHKPWGTVRLYNIVDDSFTVGSWLCLPGNKENIAIKAWIYTVEFGFRRFGHSKCLFDIRKQNRAVLYFAYLFHPSLIYEDEANYYFSLSKKDFNNYSQKVIKTLDLKNK